MSKWQSDDEDYRDDEASPYPNEAKACESRWRTRRFCPKSKPRRKRDYNIVRFRVNYSSRGIASSAPPRIDVLRLDPYTLCIPELLDEDVKAIIHRSTTHDWPSFQPWEPTGSNTPAMIDSWLARSHGNKAMFHSFISAHTALWSEAPAKFHYLITKHRTSASKAILQLDAENEITDEIIFAITLLSMSYRPQSGCCRPTLFRPPLSKLQILSHQRLPAFIEPHHSTLMRLVEGRGGVNSLKLPYLAEVIAIHDLHAATLALQPPWLDLCSSFARFEQDKIFPYGQTPSHNPSSASTDLPPSAFIANLASPLRTILLDTKHYLSLLSSYISGLLAPTTKELAVHRNVLQYRLLSLPPQEYDTVAELVRVGMLVFDVAVLWPIQVEDLRRKAATLLARTLRKCLAEISVDPGDLEDLGQEKEQWKWETIFWAATLGAMMSTSHGDPTDYFMLVLCNILAQGWVQMETYRDMEDLMSRYLWMEEACQDGGRVLWERIQAVRLEADLLGLQIAGAFGSVGGEVF